MGCPHMSQRHRTWNWPDESLRSKSMRSDTDGFACCYSVSKIVIAKTTYTSEQRGSGKQRDTQAEVDVQCPEVACTSTAGNRASASSLRPAHTSMHRVNGERIQGHTGAHCTPFFESLHAVYLDQNVLDIFPLQLVRVELVQLENGEVVAGIVGALFDL